MDRGGFGYSNRFSWPAGLRVGRYDTSGQVWRCDASPARQRVVICYKGYEISGGPKLTGGRYECCRPEAVVW